jgi:hypothetical protein
MRTTDRKKTSPARRGMVAAFRAIGRAFGFLGGRGGAVHETKRPSLAHKRLSAQQMVLEAEIRRLEAELDRVYAQVV